MVHGIVFASLNEILVAVIGDVPVAHILHDVGEKMSEFFGFLKVLVLCVAGLIALVVLLLVLVNYLPKSPLRDVIGALTARIGATAAVAAIAIPVQPILGVDGIYDIVSSILLIGYWLLLIKDIRKAFSSNNLPSQNPTRTIERF